MHNKPKTLYSIIQALTFNDCYVVSNSKCLLQNLFQYSISHVRCACLEDVEQHSAQAPKTPISKKKSSVSARLGREQLLEESEIENERSEFEWGYQLSRATCLKSIPRAHDECPAGHFALNFDYKITAELLSHDVSFWSPRLLCIRLDFMLPLVRHLRLGPPFRNSPQHGRNCFDMSPELLQ